jgi:hypothetical protein
MRPDPDSDLAGAESEYGDDTGFAAEATRTSDPDSQPVESNAPGPDDTAGLTTDGDQQDFTDQHPGDGGD